MYSGSPYRRIALMGTATLAWLLTSNMAYAQAPASSGGAVSAEGAAPADPAASSTPSATDEGQSGSSTDNATPDGAAAKEATSGASFDKDAGTLKLPSSNAGTVGDGNILTFDDGRTTSDRYGLVAGSFFAARGRGVLDRARPDYDAQGIAASGFTLYPLVGLSANATSNVFRQDNGAASDIFGEARGALVARSNWSRHRLLLDGFVDQRVFAKYSTENTTTYQARMSGQLDVVDRIFLTGAVSHKHDFSDRRSVEEFITTRAPIKFDEDEVNVGASISRGRLSTLLSFQYQNKDYANANRPDGTPLDEQFRDYKSYKGQAVLAYEFLPDREVFLSVSDEVRRFRLLSVPDRDVDIVEVLTGLSSQITPLIHGRFGIGYLQANFKGIGVKDRGGLAINTELTYLFSELTTFTLTARRELANASIPSASAAFITKVAVQADHELLRNLILSAEVTYQRANYVDNPLRSQGFGGLLGGKFLVNRRMQIKSELGYSHFHSNSPRSADTVTGLIGVNFQL